MTAEKIDTNERRGSTRLEFNPVDWIDPTLLSKFQYGVITKDQRTVMIGLLDLSQFPTVREVEAVLKVIEPESQTHPKIRKDFKSIGSKLMSLGRLWLNPKYYEKMAFGLF